MAMGNVGVIDTFLNTFTTTIDSGFGLVKGSDLTSRNTVRAGYGAGWPVLGLGC